MGSRLALLIGTYDYPDRQPFSALRAPGADLALMRHTLALPHVQFDVVDCLRNPGWRAARRAIEAFFRAGRNDDLLLYMIGHGAARGNEYYYILRGTDPSFIKSDALSGSFLREAISARQTKSKTVIIDTCRSGLLAGAMGDGAAPDERNFGFDDLPGKGVNVICAAGAAEQAYEKPDPPWTVSKDVPEGVRFYSLFTSAVCYAIREGLYGSGEYLKPPGIVDYARDLLKAYKDAYPEEDVSDPKHTIFLEEYGGPEIALLHELERKTPVPTALLTLFDRLRQEWGFDVPDAADSRPPAADAAYPAIADKTELAKETVPAIDKKISALTPKDLRSPVTEPPRERQARLRADFLPLIIAGQGDERPRPNGQVKMPSDTFEANACRGLKLSRKEVRTQVEEAISKGVIETDGPFLIFWPPR
jgi:Caspase domain